MNHLERIPWISAHPLDVKRGTFLGEMSRLATLSSQFKHYSNALLELKYIYMARGYPEALLIAWLKNNKSQRWNTRLEDRPLELNEELLILKTTFNDAWNSVSSFELCNRITSHWFSWQYAFENNLLGTEGFPSLTQGDLERFSTADGWLDALGLETRPEEDGPEGLESLEMADGPLVCRPATVGNTIGIAWALDTRKFFGKSKLIVSRKRSQNLGDLMNTWRKAVISNTIEDESLGEGFTFSPHPPDIGAASLIRVFNTSDNKSKRKDTVQCTLGRFGFREVNSVVRGLAASSRKPKV
jgi:hypothetical protein